MKLVYSFFCGIVVLLCVANSANARKATPASSNDTTGKEFNPRDPFPSEKQFTIGPVFVQDSLLPFKKGDVIRISTKNGLKHYRNKRLLNTYKIIPQLTIITIQPQCRVAPCPPMDIKAIVYHFEYAQRFLDIRNKALLLSEDRYQDANIPTTAAKLRWKKAYGLTSK